MKPYFNETQTVIPTNTGRAGGHQHTRSQGQDYAQVSYRQGMPSSGARTKIVVSQLGMSDDLDVATNSLHTPSGQAIP